MDEGGRRGGRVDKLRGVVVDVIDDYENCSGRGQSVVVAVKGGDYEHVLRSCLSVQRDQRPDDSIFGIDFKCGLTVEIKTLLHDSQVARNVASFNLTIAVKFFDADAIGKRKLKAKLVVGRGIPVDRNDPPDLGILRSVFLQTEAEDAGSENRWLIIDVENL